MKEANTRIARGGCRNLSCLLASFAAFAEAIVFAGAPFLQARAGGNAWESAYMRYRFAVDAASGSGDCMQLSDIALYDESGAAIPSSAFKLSFDTGLHGLGGFSSASPEDEGPENAVDGDTGTKWLDWRGGHDATKEQRRAVYLEFRFAAPTKLSGYAWFTANDEPKRNPSAWRFLASNDGASWTVLDAVKGFRGSDEFRSMAFRRRFADIPLYRFKVDATKFPDVAQLVEENFRRRIEAGLESPPPSSGEWPIRPSSSISSSIAFAWLISPSAYCAHVSRTSAR